MTSTPILSHLRPFKQPFAWHWRPFSPFRQAERRKRHHLAQHPRRLPRFVRQSPVAMKYRHLLGPLDELLVSRLITQWRETVWQYATRMLEAESEDEQAAVRQAVEDKTLKLVTLICLRDPD